jgi:iron complex outermembrane receptor protein
VHQYNPNYYQDHLNDPGSRFDPWPSFVLTDRSEVVKGDESNVDWRLALQYDVSDNVMVYGSAATGYIAGSPIGGGSTALSDPNEILAFEAGVKSTLLDGSMVLNAALYYNDFDGLSTTTFVQVGGTILAQTAPGGSMTAKGLEVEMNWQATDALNLTAGLSIDRSELGDFTEQESRFQEGGDSTDSNGNRYYILDGQDARFSPDYTLTVGATYDFDLGSMGTIVPGAFIYHSDDYKTQNVPYFFAYQDAFTTVDLRVTWYMADHPLSVQAFMRNATDETYLTETTVFSASRAMADYSIPRTWGVRVGYNF